MATEHDTSTNETSADARGASLEALAGIIEAASDRLGDDLRRFYPGEPAIHPDPVVDCRIVKAWGIVGALERSADGLRVGGAASSPAATMAPGGESKVPGDVDPLARFTSELMPPYEVLVQRAKQARAVSALMTGEGFDHFASMPADMQHEALWALDSLLDDAAAAVNRIAEQSATRAGSFVARAGVVR